MRWYAVLGWMAGLWVAAGVQAAWGGGMPGPVLLLAVMAGLWAGPVAGMLAGAGAGMCDAVLSGQALGMPAVAGLLCGAGAGLLATWCARRHPLIAVGAAIIVSVPLCLVYGRHDLPLRALLLFAARRAAVNALWMICIYGIVLLVSPRRSPELIYGKN